MCTTNNWREGGGRSRLSSLRRRRAPRVNSPPLKRGPTLVNLGGQGKELSQKSLLPRQWANWNETERHFPEENLALPSTSKPTDKPLAARLSNFQQANKDDESFVLIKPKDIYICIYVLSRNSPMTNISWIFHSPYRMNFLRSTRALSRIYLATLDTVKDSKR